MKPVYQTITETIPDERQYGDCFRACIASLLELSIDEVPHFCDPETFNTPRTRHWYDFCVEWLGLRGYFPLALEAKHETTKQIVGFLSAHGDVHHIITGGSPQYEGLLHSVIGKNGSIVHDPHPRNQGVIDHQEYMFLIKT